jgi:hypothetical protein
MGQRPIDWGRNSVRSAHASGEGTDENDTSERSRHFRAFEWQCSACSVTHTASSTTRVSPTPCGQDPLHRQRLPDPRRLRRRAILLEVPSVLYCFYLPLVTYSFRAIASLPTQPPGPSPLSITSHRYSNHIPSRHRSLFFIIVAIVTGVIALPSH